MVGDGWWVGGKAELFEKKLEEDTLREGKHANLLLAPFGES